MRLYVGGLHHLFFEIFFLYNIPQQHHTGLCAEVKRFELAILCLREEKFLSFPLSHTPYNSFISHNKWSKVTVLLTVEQQQVDWLHLDSAQIARLFRDKISTVQIQINALVQSYQGNTSVLYIHIRLTAEPCLLLIDTVQLLFVYNRVHKSFKGKRVRFRVDFVSQRLIGSATDGLYQLLYSETCFMTSSTEPLSYIYIYTPLLSVTSPLREAGFFFF